MIHTLITQINLMQFKKFVLLHFSTMGHPSNRGCERRPRAACEDHTPGTDRVHCVPGHSLYQ